MIEFVNKTDPPYPDGMVDTIVSIDNGRVYFKVKRKSTKSRIIFIGDRYYPLDDDLDLTGNDLIFSSNYGYYTLIPSGSSPADHLILGHNRYPYTFTREYEAVRHFDLFKDATEMVDPKKVKLVSPNHTFGIEFETSAGFMPEEECFKTGLIPLRDGSIGACEYSTIVLKGGAGLDLLRKQAETLKRYTVFDKECALHMHLGGFPLSSKAIFILYVICFYLERDMYLNMLPRLSFRTADYKSNGKDYCLKLPEFHSFLDLYKFFVGRDYGGSLSQPHPEDPTRERKWQIHNRYYGLNLINMLCYKSPKTVEFRFLRPTFNWKKLFFWVYFFDLIVSLAETLQPKLVSKEFTYIFDYVYKFMSNNRMSSLIDAYTTNANLRAFMKGMIDVNYAVTRTQEGIGDYCGRRIDIEDVIVNRWFYESGIDLEK